MALASESTGLGERICRPGRTKPLACASESARRGLLARLTGLLTVQADIQMSAKEIKELNNAAEDGDIAKVWCCLL